MRGIRGIVVVAAICMFLIFGGWLHLRDYLHGPVLQPPADPTFRDAFAFADAVGTTALVVIQDDHEIVAWGDTARKSSVHSVRKSLVSALYGIAVERGLIDIDRTLAEMGFDDTPGLTGRESSARIVDLLTSRSGIYRRSVKDDDVGHPPPGSHAPNEAFFYNDWGFNALGGIFESLTGFTLGDAFDTWIAQPTGMQDFEPEDVRYTHDEASVYPAYRFWMSARDLVRFGRLYLDGGRWQGVQVVPQAWIDASWTPSTTMENGVGYGYLWWTMPDGSYISSSEARGRPARAARRSVSIRAGGSCWSTKSIRAKVSPARSGGHWGRASIMATSPNCCACCSPHSHSHPHWGSSMRNPRTQHRGASNRA